MLFGVNKREFSFSDNCFLIFSSLTSFLCEKKCLNVFGNKQSVSEYIKYEVIKDSNRRHSQRIFIISKCENDSKII